MSEARTQYVLDTFALIAFFNREAGWEVVQSALREHMNRSAVVLMSEINWGEAYYMTAKKLSLQMADLRIKHIERLKINIVPVTRSLVKAAADFKIQYSTSKSPLSYADCFAAALAHETAAILLTDDPEFSNLKDVISIRWLTPTP
jgi:predicted nucleic acid-binding protein